MMSEQELQESDEYRLEEQKQKKVEEAERAISLEISDAARKIKRKKRSTPLLNRVQSII